MGLRYEVVESLRYAHPDGRTASVYGAHPHFGPGSGGWEIQRVGWTVRDNERGTVGCGRPPMTHAEASRLARKWNGGDDV